MYSIDINGLLRYEEELSMRTRPSASAASRILNPSTEPTMLGRAPATTSAPLSGDVLRAYDAFNTEIAKVANTGYLA